MRFAIDKNRMLPPSARVLGPIYLHQATGVGVYGSRKTHIGVLHTHWLSYVNRPHPILYVSPTYPQTQRTIVFTLVQMLSRANVPYTIITRRIMNSLS